MDRTRWKLRVRALIAEMASAWELTMSGPFPALSCNYAAPVVRADGSPAVLKLSPADSDFEAEVDALTLFDGRASLRLLDVDRARGAMLLERAEPGESLASIPDDLATEQAAQIMQELWRPVPDRHRFPAIADWAAGMERHRQRFDGTSGILPAPLFDLAERLFVELLATQEAIMVLHGDLHHGNILSSTRRGWLAIDPKGIVGEPAYETANWLRNPLSFLEWDEPGRVLRRRIDQFGDLLGFDRRRIRDWGIAQTMLSACWYIEDDDPRWRNDVAIAHLLSEI